MRQIPAPLELYKHFKGNIYQIKCIAKHSETGEPLVIYQAMYGDYSIYARPLPMFMEEVDHVKYPDVKQVYRFEKVSGETAIEHTVETAIEPPVKSSMDSLVAQPSEQVTEPSAESVTEPSSEDGFVDPRVIQFLDARTYEEKLTILAGMRESLTNDMINIMAVSEDIEVKPGSVEERYEELKNCLVTLDRFECNRLR